MEHLPIRRLWYHQLGILHDSEWSASTECVMGASRGEQASVVSQRCVEQHLLHVEREMRGYVLASVG